MQILCSINIMQKQQGVQKIKIVLLGNRSVGKSSIIRRYILDDFPYQIQPTIGVDYMSKTLKFKNKDYRLELWDTAGQEKYRSIVKGYLKGAHACIYVYDCKNINSFLGLDDWINLFESVNSQQCPSIIACNKCDLCSQQDQEAVQTAKSLLKLSHKKINDVQQVRCSAKTSENINEIFYKLLEKIAKLQKIQHENGQSLLLNRKIQNYMALKCCQN